MNDKKSYKFLYENVKFIEKMNKIARKMTSKQVEFFSKIINSFKKGG